MNLGKNIFAIEGEWSNNLKKKETIKSTLTLLNEVCDIDYIFRKVNTVESLLQYLSITAKARYKSYDIIVLASHGSRYDIELSKSESIDIEELADKCDNLFKEKIVHFSSCNIMLDTKRVTYFKEKTGAKWICGYTKSINFLESSLFDIALLNKLNLYERISYVDDSLKKNYNALYNQLGFKMI